MTIINHDWEQHGATYVDVMTRAADRTVLWSPAPLPEIPFLQALYDAVLARSEKRMPKWKFRLADDLVVEIQPKLTRAGRLFHWVALQCDGADAKMLTQPRRQLAKPWLILQGRLAQRPGDDGYTLRCSTVRWSSGDLAAGRALRESVLNAFIAGRFDQFTPGMLLRPQCLICGKALTDPVSQARYIGPECAGTSSVHVPWLRDAGD